MLTANGDFCFLVGRHSATFFLSGRLPGMGLVCCATWTRLSICRRAKCVEASAQQTRLSFRPLLTAGSDSLHIHSGSSARVLARFWLQRQSQFGFFLASASGPASVFDGRAEPDLSCHFVSFRFLSLEPTPATVATRANKRRRAAGGRRKEEGGRGIQANVIR